MWVDEVVKIKELGTCNTLYFPSSGMSGAALERIFRVASGRIVGPLASRTREAQAINFELSMDAKYTFIQFRHSGWRKSTDFQGHCSMRWAVFLLSLKRRAGARKRAPRSI